MVALLIKLALGIYIGFAACGAIFRFVVFPLIDVLDGSRWRPAAPPRLTTLSQR